MYGGELDLEGGRGFRKKIGQLSRRRRGGFVFQVGQKIVNTPFFEKRGDTISPPPSSTLKIDRKGVSFFPLSPDCSSVHIPPPPRKKFDKSVFNGVYFFPFFCRHPFFFSPELRIWENGGGERKCHCLLPIRTIRLAST